MKWRSPLMFSSDVLHMVKPALLCADDLNTLINRCRNTGVRVEWDSLTGKEYRSQINWVGDSKNWNLLIEDLLTNHKGLVYLNDKKEYVVEIHNSHPFCYGASDGDKVASSSNLGRAVCEAWVVSLGIR